MANFPTSGGNPPPAGWPKHKQSIGSRWSLPEETSKYGLSDGLIAFRYEFLLSINPIY